MKLTTQGFGEIEINTEDIISFGDGLPGFADDKRFVILLQEDDGGISPIRFLQSVDNGDLSFVLVDMTAFLPEYRPLVLVELAKEQGDNFDPDNTMIYNIATIYEELMDSTVNLKAPIVVNLEQKIGRQFLCGDDFPIRARLFDQSATKGCGCGCGCGGDGKC
ncbi:MAG: flagellar assembly protein FliW [Defluviitaleaceae bacterium]|nr:flagellar assembly protein FliW [Defluviitaleaceae bacterium]